ncbi:DUF6527 family protein [Microbispora hainanensis]|uniref:DUF6527 family protein n=1 Tax=Microbispora hainanensis TaxID=568844 RepID=A0ABZ1SLF3_9ACTN|nr:DUF6527 family protein [Microbispora hainanensis]
MTRLTMTYEFVDHAPENLEEGILYISIPFTSVLHLCCCGCGREVVTPLNPRDWRLIFDGETVSLEPSIGNWSFPCQSHYWIRNSTVRWVRPRSRDRADNDWTRNSPQPEAPFSMPERPPWPGQLRQLLHKIRHEVVRRMWDRG